MSDRFESDRPKRRARVTRAALDVAKSWKDFGAALQTGDHADHGAQFRARIVVGDDEYDGHTGTGKGHAEMAGLHELLEAVGEERLKELLDGGEVEVDCVGKPCCAHCSTMLGLLGVRPYTNATRKTDRTMLAGSAWGLSMKLRDFVVSQFNIRTEDLEDFAAMGQKDFDRLL